MSSGGKQKEPKSAQLLRARQLADMADLDEEENRKFKALLNARSTGRAFRTQGSPRMASNTRGSLATSSGFRLPAMLARLTPRSTGNGGGSGGVFGAVRAVRGGG